MVLQRVNFNLLDRIGEGGGSIGSAEVCEAVWRG
jgi:hypothetical protein